MKKRRRVVTSESSRTQPVAADSTTQPSTDGDCRHDVVYNGLCAICGQEVVSATAAGGPGHSSTPTAPSAPTAAAAALYDAFHPSQSHDLPHVDDLAASTPHSSLSNSSSSTHSSSSSASSLSSSAATPASHRALVVGTRLLHLTTSAFQSQLEANMQRLFQSRKLMLVLDIDHTLLHTTDDPALSYIDPLQLPPSIHHFALPHPMSPQLPSHRHFLNLRPHLTHFLASLAPLYDLHIYTMGSRPYAQHILPLIDPSGQLVKGRVVTRSESEGGVKVLERMCACDETMCVIVDDRVDVWSGEKRGSVVRALEYRYFAGREVYNREGKGGGEKKGAAQIAMDRMAAEEDQMMLAAMQQYLVRDSLQRQRNAAVDSERKENTPAAAAKTAEAAVHQARHDAQSEHEAVVERNEQKDDKDDVIVIPEEVLIDEEKESPPNSPTVTTSPRREVIAIDDDDDGSKDTAELEAGTVDVDGHGWYPSKKPKKRVRFQVPLIDSIRQIELDEAMDGDDDVWEDHSDVLDVSNEQTIAADNDNNEFDQQPVVSPVLPTQLDESKVDNVLLSLLSVLRALHLLFFAHYTVTPPTSSAHSSSSLSHLPTVTSSSSLSPPAPSTSPAVEFSLPLPTGYTLPSLLSSLKASVLHDCHILFSGAFPSAQSAADTDIGKLAIAFGAAVYDAMDGTGRGSSSNGSHRITHIVAARDGSDKIKAGLRLKDRRPHVVHLSWLSACAAHFQRADERLFPLSLAAQADADEKAGVGRKENARGYVNPALVQHTQSVVTPLQLLRGLQKYRPSLAVLTAMRAAADEESNDSWIHAKPSEEKKESSSSSAASINSSSSATNVASEGRIRRKRKAQTTNSGIGQYAAELRQKAAADSSEAVTEEATARTASADMTAPQSDNVITV